MGRHPHPEMVRMTVKVPGGTDGYWKVIRELDAKGPWSVLDVFDRTSTPHKESASDYIKRLVRGGFADVAGERPGSGTPTRLYRLLKRPTDAPSLRRDGTLLEMPAQQRMWNAIRSMQVFSVSDVAFAAGTKQPVPTLTARRYVRHLATAGYLAELPDERFRLKRGMNTGPRSPKILRLHVVWDSNRNEVVGAEDIESEVVQ